MTIFDNEAGPPNDGHAITRARAADRRDARRRPPCTTQFHHQPPVLSDGARQRPAAGQRPHVHGLGHLELLHRVRARRTVLFDGHLTPGTLSYRAFKETWTGTPTTVPSLVATRARRGRHAVRQLELRHRGGRLGRARRPRRRSSRRRRGGEARRLRDRDLAAAGATATWPSRRSTARARSWAVEAAEALADAAARARRRARRSRQRASSPSRRPPRKVSSTTRVGPGAPWPPGLPARASWNATKPPGAT